MSDIKVMVTLTNGFEEVEAITIIDILRRGNVNVDIVSLGSELKCIGSHNVTIESNTLFSNLNINEYSGIIIPGGPGVFKILENIKIIELIQNFNNDSKLIASICAAPQILGKSGIMKDKKYTSYPGCDKFLEESFRQEDNAFIIEGNIITGKSVGTAIEFSLAVLEYLKGKEVSDKVRKEIVIL